MKRTVCLSVMGFLCGVTSWAQSAQQPPTPPVSPAVRPTPPRQPAAPPSATALQGEQRLRWICQQLKLDPAQSVKMESLIAVFNAAMEEERKDTAGLIQRIAQKFAEVRAAEAAGNTELVAKLKAEANEMRPGLKAEAAFFDALTPSLNDEQKAKLAQFRDAASRQATASELRPVQVLRAARRVNLTTEQRQKLEVLLEGFRSEMAAGRARSAADASARTEQLVRDVRAILTPEQAQKYDSEITTARVSAVALPPRPPTGPPPGRTTRPATQPPMQPTITPATRPAAPPAAPGRPQ